MSGDTGETLDRVHNCCCRVLQHAHEMPNIVEESSTLLLLVSRFDDPVSGRLFLHQRGHVHERY